MGPVPSPLPHPSYDPVDPSHSRIQRRRIDGGQNARLTAESRLCDQLASAIVSLRLCRLLAQMEVTPAARDFRFWGFNGHRERGRRLPELTLCGSAEGAVGLRLCGFFCRSSEGTFCHIGRKADIYREGRNATSHS